jgi:hypothetical protein
MWSRAPTQWIEEAEARQMTMFDAEAKSIPIEAATGQQRKRQPAARRFFAWICSTAASFGALPVRANLLKF